jgi:hydroxymethylbilane synthase
MECQRSLIRCTAERSFLATLEGGCSIPIGCTTKLSPENTHDARVEDFKLEMTGCVTSVDGVDQIIHSLSGTIRNTKRDNMIQDAIKLGKSLADAMVELGAKKILDSIKNPVS